MSQKAIRVAEDDSTKHLSSFKWSIFWLKIETRIHQPESPRSGTRKLRSRTHRQVSDDLYEQLAVSTPSSDSKDVKSVVASCCRRRYCLRSTARIEVIDALGFTGNRRSTCMNLKPLLYLLSTHGAFRRSNRNMRVFNRYNHVCTPLTHDHMATG